MTHAEEAYVSSANIFADLDLPDAETHFLKAQIVSEIYRLATASGFTDAQTGEAVGLSSDEVSRLFRGDFRDCAVERLIGFLTRFEQDVEIVVRPHAKRGETGAITFRRSAA
jgi:predicted XRE-type DNA-binding protein